MTELLGCESSLKRAKSYGDAKENQAICRSGYWIPREREGCCVTRSCKEKNTPAQGWGDMARLPAGHMTLSWRLFPHLNHEAWGLSCSSPKLASSMMDGVLSKHEAFCWPAHNWVLVSADLPVPGHSTMVPHSGPAAGMRLAWE